jgi:hypothetical protein
MASSGRRASGMLAVLTLAIAAGGIGADGAASAAADTSRRPVSVPAASPDHSGRGNQYGVNGIDMDAADDGWYVGSWYGTDSDARTLTRAHHWDGTNWTLVKTANPGASSDILESVDAISPSLAWSVGSQQDDSGEGSLPSPLAEGWDGSKWAAAVLPDVGPGELSGIDDTSADDVWAVGRTESYVEGAFVSHGLVDHWDGTTWSVVPNPTPKGCSVTLRSVTALSADDVWAAGYGSCPNFTALVEHWNGAKWTVTEPPAPPISILVGIGASGAGDLWAIGDTFSGTTSIALVEHYDGTRWTTAHVPKAAGERLAGVSVVSSTDVWVSGSKPAPSGQGSTRTLMLHFDGARWRVVVSPNRERTDGANRNQTLNGVSLSSAGSGWAVGTYWLDGGEHIKPMVARWDGARWTNDRLK